MANIGMNPILTTNAAGLFGIKSDGYVQGLAMDDPAVRYALAGGIIDPSSSNVLYGGIPITEYLPGVNSRPLGSLLDAAKTVGSVSGFAVFNQGHNGLTSPQSPVPTFAPGMSIGFYRLGSGARIPLPASASVLALGTGKSTTVQKLVWDFTNNQITLFGTISATLATTAITYNATTGLATATTASAHGLAVGNIVEITGADPDGYNGVVQVAAITADTFDYTPLSVPTATAATKQGSVAAVSSSDVALPVKLIGIQEGNSKIVSYDSTTGFATWVDGSSCALVLV